MSRNRFAQVVAVVTAVSAFGTPAIAQDGPAKPRLELADSARRNTRTAPAVNEPRANTPAVVAAAATAPAKPALTKPAPAKPGSADFRPDFVRNQTALGVVLYAPAFATVVARDSWAWAASYLLVAGGSFVASSEISRRMTVTNPMQRLATGLPIRGAVAGALFSSLIDADQRATAGAILLGSVGGTAVALTRGRSMDDGEAAATLFGSDVLGLAGWGLSTAAGMQNGSNANATRVAMTLGGMVLGAPLGQAYAALAGYSVTPGDLTAMTAAGGVGMLAGLSVVANGGPGEREIAAAMTIGGLAGLVVGDRLLVRRYDHTGDEGGMMIAGGVAGGLMGAGAALLTTGSQSRWTAFTGAMTTAGAAAGVAWAQYYLKPKADGVARLGALRLNPIGVVAAATRMNGAYTLGTIRF